MTLMFAVTAAAFLVVGFVLEDGLRAPWDLFFPLAFALSAGSLAGTAAAYLPWRIPERRNRGNCLEPEPGRPPHL
ncbi:hypothetical protein LADH09A_006056 [Micromonospora sp. LAH09]|nr:hypothetical protein [Micromonospora cabrerizensis]